MTKTVEPRALKSLADRVRWLVDEYHAGSVNAAAKSIGVAQPTLDRIQRGDAKTPRTEALRKIADYHGTTIDWLLSGRGEQPNAGLPPVLGVTGDRLEVMQADDAMRAAYFRWRYLVAQLSINDDTRALLEKLPFALATFRFQFSSLERQGAKKEQRAQTALEGAIREFVIQMVLMNSLNWTDLLEAFLAIVKSSDDVAGALDRALPSMCIHDPQFLAWLQEKGKMPRELGELYRSYLAERQPQAAKKGA